MRKRCLQRPKCSGQPVLATFWQQTAEVKVLPLCCQFLIRLYTFPFDYGSCSSRDMKLTEGRIQFSRPVRSTTLPSLLFQLPDLAKEAMRAYGPHLREEALVYRLAYRRSGSDRLEKQPNGRAPARSGVAHFDAFSQRVAR